MSYAVATSLTIFAVTLFLMIKCPRGVNLGLAAGIGALASLLLGTVTVNDAVLFLVRYGAYNV
jgi:Na+/H+ antiporter NhaD/arsenite permease-like protein